MTFPILPSNSAVGGYQVQRSLRFNSADSAYLNRTPSVAGNRKTWTWSGWVKRSELGNFLSLFIRYENRGGAYFYDYTGIWIQQDNNLYFAHRTSNVVLGQIVSSGVLRDVSAWYHIVAVFDTTNAVAADRMRLYVNNVNVGPASTTITQNTDGWINTTSVHDLGAWNAGTIYPIGGYLAEVNFIDGQALTPSSFGETNATTGQWQPKRYTGTYGTNGFYLNFSDNSGTTATTLGKDYSGNGNNWTPNNFSVTPGAGNDSMIDVPTNWADGGNGRGNYCVLNPIVTGNVIAPSNGNLESSLASGSYAYFNTVGTTAFTSGKWYWECSITSIDSSAGQWVQFGIVATTTPYTNNALGYSGNMSNGYAYFNNGGRAGQGTSVTGYGATFTINDVIGVALDLDAGTITFYKNGVSQGQAFSGISLTTSWLPIIQMFRSPATTISAWINFGQRPFAYTPPSGFKALNTQNLPTPTIGATTATQAGKYFNSVLWTANGGVQSITGVGFQPDFLWIKDRQNANAHSLQNIVVGASRYLSSNNNLAETLDTNFVASIDSDGWSMGSVNYGSGRPCVAWAWKANGAGVTNTAGTITSTVSANTTSGFSVVTYTGNGGGNESIGHGLGVKPAFIITKGRSGATVNNWITWHSTFNTSDYIALNLSNGKNYAGPATVLYGGSSATASNSTTYYIGIDINTNAATYVAYCFAAIPGYSAFGSYTGNGSADGPFVYTGFRPAYVLIKMSSSTGNWVALDKSRLGYNVDNNPLYPNLADAEATTDLIDILSNGFKIRSTDASVNTSSGTYIYAAFAESPFKYANAR